MKKLITIILAIGLSLIPLSTQAAPVASVPLLTNSTSTPVAYPRLGSIFTPFAIGTTTPSYEAVLSVYGSSTSPTSTETMMAVRAGNGKKALTITSNGAQPVVTLGDSVTNGFLDVLGPAYFGTAGYDSGRLAIGTALFADEACIYGDSDDGLACKTSQGNYEYGLQLGGTAPINIGGVEASVPGLVTIGSSLKVSGTGAFFDGQFVETSTQKGIYLGRPSGAASSESGRMMFSNGTAAQNWEIDNSGGIFRWFLPSNLQMTLSNDSNGLTLQNSTNGVLKAKGSLSSYFTGNLGIGTTTPGSKLVIQGTAGSTLKDELYIASSTSARLFSVNSAGNITTGGGTPTLSSCGTGATVSGNDNAGTITTGSGSVPSCVVTFARQKAVSPKVLCSGGATYCWASSKSTLNVTISFGVDSGGGAQFDYLFVE